MYPFSGFMSSNSPQASNYFSRPSAQNQRSRSTAPCPGCRTQLPSPLEASNCHSDELTCQNSQSPASDSDFTELFMDCDCSCPTDSSYAAETSQTSVTSKCYSDNSLPYRRPGNSSQTMKVTKISRCRKPGCPSSLHRAPQTDCPEGPNQTTRTSSGSFLPNFSNYMTSEQNSEMCPCPPPQCESMPRGPRGVSPLQSAFTSRNPKHSSPRSAVMPSYPNVTQQCPAMPRHPNAVNFQQSSAMLRGPYNSVPGGSVGMTRRPNAASSQQNSAMPRCPNAVSTEDNDFLPRCPGCMGSPQSEDSSDYPNNINATSRSRTLPVCPNTHLAAPGYPGASRYPGVANTSISTTMPLSSRNAVPQRCPGDESATQGIPRSRCKIPACPRNLVAMTCPGAVNTSINTTMHLPSGNADPQIYPGDESTNQRIPRSRCKMPACPRNAVAMTCPGAVSVPQSEVMPSHSNHVPTGSVAPKCHISACPKNVASQRGPNQPVLSNAILNTVPMDSVMPKCHIPACPKNVATQRGPNQPVSNDGILNTVPMDSVTPKCHIPACPKNIATQRGPNPPVPSNVILNTVPMDSVTPKCHIPACPKNVATQRGPNQPVPNNGILNTVPMDSVTPKCHIPACPKNVATQRGPNQVPMDSVMPKCHIPTCPKNIATQRGPNQPMPSNLILNTVPMDSVTPRCHIPACPKNIATQRGLNQVPMESVTPKCHIPTCPKNVTTQRGLNQIPMDSITPQCHIPRCAKSVATQGISNQMPMDSNTPQFHIPTCPINIATQGVSNQIPMDSIRPQCHIPTCPKNVATQKGPNQPGPNNAVINKCPKSMNLLPLHQTSANATPESTVKSEAPLDASSKSNVPWCECRLPNDAGTMTGVDSKCPFYDETGDRKHENWIPSAAKKSCLRRNKSSNKRICFELEDTIINKIQYKNVKCLCPEEIESLVILEAKDCDIFSHIANTYLPLNPGNFAAKKKLQELRLQNLHTFYQSMFTSLPAPSADAVQHEQSPEVLANFMHLLEQQIDPVLPPQVQFNHLFDSSNSSGIGGGGDSIYLSSVADGHYQDVVVPLDGPTNPKIGLFTKEFRDVSIRFKNLGEGDAPSDDIFDSIKWNDFDIEKLNKTFADDTFTNDDFYTARNLGAEPIKMLDVADQPEELKKDMQSGIQYFVEACTPQYISRVQLRGHNPPTWFPGFYFSCTDTKEPIEVLRSPSQAFLRAWSVSDPRCFDECSVITL
ncbi:titin isoform X7 [Aethina tumida]|uniref:titin isoform X7 n=1 Tax=Aethina tumida TaxID=116153 RepID=UPI002148973D|nr:titin isoform X7 [Aethina tumida]